MKRCLKYLLILPPLLLCAAAVCLSHSRSGPKPQYISAATEEARLEWLASQGLEVVPVSSQAITVPLDFSGNYADYASLQEQLRLPLGDYAGQRAVMYTYCITESEPAMYVELLTAGGYLIGVQCYIPEDSETLDLQGKPYKSADE